MIIISYQFDRAYRRPMDAIFRLGRKVCDNLAVKWILLQFVLALKLVCIGLGHHQGVLISYKDLSLVNFFNSTPSKVSFLYD